MGRSDRFLLEPGKGAVREARLRVRAFSELPRETEANAELVVSELVANSVLHARLGPEDRIEVTLDCEEGRISIEVADGGGFSRTARSKAGWGFRVLDAVCEQWHAENGRVRASISWGGACAAGQRERSSPLRSRAAWRT
jgi:two-component sensor histidine kinase